MNIREKSKNKEFHSKIIEDYKEQILSISEIKKKYAVSHGFITNLAKKYKVFSPRKTRPLIKWEESDLDWLINNYNKLGRNKCADELRLSRHRIYQKAKSLGLTRKNKKMTPELERIIRKNYSKIGLKKCMEITGLTKNQIIRITNQYKLKLNNETLKSILSDSAKKCGVSKYRFNMNELYSIKKPRVAYMLGIIWADGHCYKNINGITISLLKDDMNEILHVFTESGKWGLSERTQQTNGKKVTKLQICELELSNFFRKNDYEIKSGASPDKILSLIPEHLRHYWWRGFIDGDGCFCCGKEFSITSCFNQDWNFYKKLCQKLNIKYKVEKLIKPNSKASRVRLARRKEIIKLGNYIYKNYDKDKIGLNRKYLKWEEISTKQRKPLVAFYITFDKSRDKYALYVRNKKGKMKFKIRKKTKEELVEYYNTIL